MFSQAGCVSLGNLSSCYLVIGLLVSVLWFVMCTFSTCVVMLSSLRVRGSPFSVVFFFLMLSGLSRYSFRFFSHTMRVDELGW